MVTFTTRTRSMRAFADKDKQITFVLARELTKLHRCFTVPHARLGWLLLLIGVFSWQLFGRHADWSGLLFLQQPLTKANGSVLDTTETGFTIGDEFNGASIRSVLFEFVDQTGLKRQGQSWTERQTPKRGEQVAIEYVTSRPEINRITDLRSGPLPLWAGAVLLFPLFGVLCILRAVLFNGDRWSSARMNSQSGSEPSDEPKSRNCRF